MPKKLSSPSKHGSGSEQTYARRIAPVNKADFQLSSDSGSKSKSKGAATRSYQRLNNLFSNEMTGNETHDNRTIRARSRLWGAQEELRAGGWSAPELTTLSKNYAEAAQYHADKGSYKKAEHYHALSKAAKQEAITSKRVATTAKNKADRAARVKVASDRVAAKKSAKSVKTPKK